MRDYIYLFVGPSGSGKSTVADLLKQSYDWTILQSYTTRKPRFKGEKGHIFVTKEDFDKLDNKCAYTEFDGNEYCATSNQVDESDIYIIDPAGIEYFIENYKGYTEPVIVIFKVSKRNAYKRMRMRGDTRGMALKRLWNDMRAFNNVVKKAQKTGKYTLCVDTNKNGMAKITYMIKNLMEGAVPNYETEL